MLFNYTMTDEPVVNFTRKYFYFICFNSLIKIDSRFACGNDESDKKTFKKTLEPIW